METIIANIPTYFDYNWLIHSLAGYSSPRVKINSLLKKGEIIRIKKGLYIPGDKYNRLFSHGVLANLIYGPSYVSFEYALARHGMIPERVYTVTSACIKRKKKFQTPVGRFEYIKVPVNAYSEGVSLVAEADVTFLIASPEKALADFLAVSPEIESMSDLEEFLYDDKRMEYEEIRRLDAEKMKAIASRYHKSNITLFSDYLTMRVHHE